MGPCRALETCLVYLLIAYVLLVLLPGLGGWGLQLPDEIRYREVAREMGLTRSYLVPILNGEIYAEKPPLFFWLTLWAGRGSSGGAGRLSGRWISVVSLAGTVLALYLLGRLFFDVRTGLWAGFFLVASAHPFWFAHLGTMDGLFVMLMTYGIVGFFAASRHVLSPVTGYGLSGLCMGLAVLTKGPLGILLPGSVLAVTLFGKEPEQRAGRKALAYCLFVALVTVLLWLVPACLEGGAAYTKTILWRQNIGRAVSSWSHRKPFYFYLGVLPAGLAPWTLLLPIPAWVWAKKIRNEGIRERENWKVLAAWGCTIFVLLSLISGKRDKYLMPIYPAFALLLARGLVLADRKRGDEGAGLLLRAPLYTLWAGLCSVCLAAAGTLLCVSEGTLLAWLQRLVSHWDPAYASLLDPFSRHILLLLSLGGILCSAWGLIRVRKGRLQGALIPFLLVLPAIGAYLNLELQPVLGPFQSPRSFCERIRKDVKDLDRARVALYRQDYSGGFNLYLERIRIPVLRKPDDVEDFFARRGPAYLLSSGRLLAGLERSLGQRGTRILRIAHQRIFDRDTWLVTVRRTGTPGPCLSEPFPGTKGSDVAHGGDVDPAVIETAGTTLDPLSIPLYDLDLNALGQGVDCRILFSRACIDDRFLVNDRQGGCVAFHHRHLHSPGQGRTRGRTDQGYRSHDTPLQKRGGKEEAEGRGDEGTASVRVRHA